MSIFNNGGKRQLYNTLIALLVVGCFLINYSSSAPASLLPEELAIEKYLNKRASSDGSSSSTEKQKTSNRFHIQGWRWHTLSLIRDAGRLGRLAEYVSQDIAASRLQSEEHAADMLDSAAEHVINFNLRGLHSVEDELFFPWLKSKLISSNTQDEESDGILISEAFSNMIENIEAERAFINKLAQQVREQAKITSSSVSVEERIEAASNVAQLSSSLYSRAKDIFDKQERYIVPAVASVVNESEQRSFNNKVIRKLGILDSRLHLVGMHDAVMSEESEHEKALFADYIPMIPRIMIPRWRRTLYEPVAGNLDGF